MGKGGGGGGRGGGGFGAATVNERGLLVAPSSSLNKQIGLSIGVGGTTANLLTVVSGGSKEPNYVSRNIANQREVMGVVARVARRYAPTMSREWSARMSGKQNRWSRIEAEMKAEIAREVRAIVRFK